MDRPHGMTSRGSLNNLVNLDSSTSDLGPRGSIDLTLDLSQPGGSSTPWQPLTLDDLAVAQMAEVRAAESAASGQLLSDDESAGPRSVVVRTAINSSMVVSMQPLVQFTVPLSFELDFECPEYLLNAVAAATSGPAIVSATAATAAAATVASSNATATMGMNDDDGDGDGDGDDEGTESA